MLAHKLNAMFIDIILKHVSITKFILLWERLGTVSHLAPKIQFSQGSLSDWKTWKNGKAFSSQGKVREFEWTGKIRENIQNTGKFMEFQTNIVCYF